MNTLRAKSYRRTLLCTIALATALTACTRKHQSDGRNASDLAGIIPMGGADYGVQTIEARYMTWPEPDTMLIYINGVRFKVAADGDIIDANNNTYLDLDNDGQITKLFYHQKGGDLFLFFADKTEQSRAAYAKRIRISDKRMVWAALVPGYSIARPVIRGQYAYVCSYGFIGKIKLKTGQFEWRFSNLNENGRFEQFESIDFPERHQVRFVAPHVYSSEKDTITVNDITGEILRIN